MRRTVFSVRSDPNPGSPSLLRATAPTSQMPRLSWSSIPECADAAIGTIREIHKYRHAYRNEAAGTIWRSASATSNAVLIAASEFNEMDVIPCFTSHCANSG